LLTALRGAEQRHEYWGSAGEVREISLAWKNDSDVRALLDLRKPPPIE
jgi:hypothetical protein